MALRVRLRSETATLHAQLEALPFVAALQAGMLPLLMADLDALHVDEQPGIAWAFAASLHRVGDDAC
jgi:hypothetical protein